MGLLDGGLTMKEVSHRVGTSIASVSRWRQAVAEGGLGALAAKPVPGRPRKLSKPKCSRLLELLLKGAMAYGYPNELWTLKRIARVILREFGVGYHPTMSGGFFGTYGGPARCPNAGPCSGTRRPWSIGSATSGHI